MNLLTLEEIYDSYEWRLLKRMLKDEYPFIKDIKLSYPDDVNKYGLIFFDAIVDPFQMAKEWDLDVSDMLIFQMLIKRKDGSYVKSPYGNTMFSQKGNPDTTAYQDMKDFEDEVNDIAYQLKKTEVIPTKFKLPPDRKFHISTLTVPSTYPIPNHILSDYINKNPFMRIHLTDKEKNLFTQGGEQIVDNYTP